MVLSDGSVMAVISAASVLNRIRHLLQGREKMVSHGTWKLFADFVAKVRESKNTEQKVLLDEIFASDIRNKVINCLIKNFEKVFGWNERKILLMELIVHEYSDVINQTISEKSVELSEELMGEIGSLPEIIEEIRAGTTEILPVKPVNNRSEQLLLFENLLLTKEVVNEKTGSAAAVIPRLDDETKVEAIDLIMQFFHAIYANHSEPCGCFGHKIKGF